jgi:hypothetical protein
LKSISSVKISGSGQKRIVVPLFLLALPFVSFEVERPRAYPCDQANPSRKMSAVIFSESAFTTETPTPCSPPEMLYPPPPNLPPAFNVVSATSTAGRRSFAFGMGFTGIPAPSSCTDTLSSSWSVTTIFDARPAIASSTALSTTS